VLNVQLLYHEISARKLDNALPVEPEGGEQRIKEEEDSRRGKEVRDEGDWYKKSTEATRREIQPSHHARYTYCLRRRNETTGRKRQSTIVSTRKPRRNDTRASANWALEVTPSRGMALPPSEYAPTTFSSSTDFLPTPSPPPNLFLPHHLASSSYIAN